MARVKYALGAKVKAGDILYDCPDGLDREVLRDIDNGITRDPRLAPDFYKVLSKQAVTPTPAPQPAPAPAPQPAKMPEVKPQLLEPSPAMVAWLVEVRSLVARAEKIGIPIPDKLKAELDIVSATVK